MKRSRGGALHDAQRTSVQDYRQQGQAARRLHTFANSTADASRSAAWRCQSRSGPPRHCHPGRAATTRAFADAGYIARQDGRWTLHPIIEGELAAEFELGFYLPHTGTLTTRYDPLSSLLKEYIARHGLPVDSVTRSTERTVNPIHETITGLARQRAEADADILALSAILRLNIPIDDWPLARATFEQSPSRALTDAARALLPPHAAESIEGNWQTTGWWWGL